MSSGAVAMPFDAAFGIGPRSAFAWPASHLDSNSLTSDLGIINHPSDAVLTPETTPRSMTSSPPRGSFTPDMKKHRERSRRDNKMSQRMQRSDSNPYIGSPSLLHDATGALGMPMYSTGAPPMSLLSEPVSSLPTQSYFGQYSPATSYSPSSSYSPPMAEAVQFPNYTQSMPTTYTLSMDYPAAAYPASDYSSRSSPMSMASENGMMYQMPSVMNSGVTSAPEGSHVRVVQSRPKPRCWEHGCNGRQFSTFSNLLRHQREKSGQATKATCPNCGAEFTRTTARNGHMLHDKCKQRRNNTSSISSASSSSG